MMGKEKQFEELTGYLKLIESSYSNVIGDFTLWYTYANNKCSYWKKRLKMKSRGYPFS